VLKLFNVTRKMAVIEMTGGAQIVLTRSRKDGTTVGFRGHSTGFKTLDVEELMIGLLYVTKTDDELREMGVTIDASLTPVRRPKRKRNKDKSRPF